MRIYHSAKIGFGYILQDSDYKPFPDERDYATEAEYQEAEEEHFDYIGEVYDSEYCIALDDGEDPTFFGIILDSTDIDNPYTVIDFSETDSMDWYECKNEFKRFFPDSEQTPQYFLLSEVKY